MARKVDLEPDIVVERQVSVRLSGSVVTDALRKHLCNVLAESGIAPKPKSFSDIKILFADGDYGAPGVTLTYEPAGADNG